jgi:hypothetical protein
MDVANSPLSASAAEAKSATGSSRARIRRVFKKLIAGFVLVVVIAAVGETFLRYTERRGLDRDHLFQKWRNNYRKQTWSLFMPLHTPKMDHLRPNIRVETETLNGERMLVETNSKGFRTHEFDAKPTSGHPRVICLGGSTTFFGPTNDTTYPALLEALLREQHAEVLNFGVAGNDTSNNRECFLHEGICYEPSVVVSYEGINDTTRLHLRHYERTFRFLLGRSRLVRQCISFRPGEGAYRELIRSTTIANLEAIRAACAERGILFVTSTFAMPNLDTSSTEFREFCFHDWMVQYAEYDGATFDDYRWMIGIVNDEISQFARTKNLPIVRMAEEFEADSDRSFEDCCHFTNLGRERQAAAVARVVRPLLSSDRR